MNQWKVFKNVKKALSLYKVKRSPPVFKVLNGFSVVGIILNAQYFVLIHEEVLSPMIADINLKN